MNKTGSRIQMRINRDPDAQQLTPKAEMFRIRWILKFIDLLDPDPVPYPGPYI
jgi:hypothetical protein